MRSSTSTRSSADQGSRRRTASVRIRTPAGPALNRGRSSRSAPVSAASPTAATAASSRPAGSAMRTSRTATTAPAAAVAVATGRGDQEWLCGPGRVVRSAVGASSDAGSIPASVRSPCGYRGVTMRDAVIVEAVRTPVGRRQGALSGVHPVDLSAHVLRALADRTGLDPAVVDDVVWGCVSQVGEQAINVGRNAVLAAGWPESVPGTTVDRQCGSSQQAVHFAAAAVASGQCDVVVAGGVESMSRVPMGSSVGSGVGMPFGPLVSERYDGVVFNQGVGAEMMVRRWGLSRRQLDEYSLGSHAKAAAAQDAGAFEAEIAPVPLPDGRVVSADEGMRRDTTLEAL